MAANLQETAAKYANGELAKLNAQAARTAGVEAMWFRATPQARSTDVIFQTYTLHNVDQCPLNLYVLYTETNYDDAALTFGINGIEYKPTLTLEIPILIWKEATNNDGTIPQEKDIVFLPLTRKLWQVKSMTPVSAMGGQITSYKTMMETYRPEADRFVSGGLKEAIDNNTVNIDKLFGNRIEEEKEDIADDKQSSQFSSTERDKYKDLNPNKRTYCTIMDGTHRTKTLMEDIEISGHLAGRSCYDMNVQGVRAVEYLNIYDPIEEGESRCLSLLVRPLNDKNAVTGKVSKIESDGQNRKYAFYKITADSAKFNEGDSVVLSRGIISLYGCVNSIEGNIISICIPVKMIQKLEDSVNNWKEMSGYTITRSTPINLLSGESENGDLDISIVGLKFISITLCGKEYSVKMKKELTEGKWYGIIINMQSELEVNIFETVPELGKTLCSTQRMQNWEENIFTSYYLKSSPCNMTNIRLYDIANTEIDKQLEDLISYNIKNNSHAIINDSADIFIENKYYGEQR